MDEDKVIKALELVKDVLEELLEEKRKIEEDIRNRKPCPKCGGSCYVTTDAGPTLYWVVCEDADGEHCNYETKSTYDSEKEAWEAHNNGNVELWGDT
ncbi:hypothetical protein CL614_00420 [archaeon]|nr:hypothetical protein [archaeon]|tara:strand:+ start:284 stop:574 length:291 start_codon:yes stop_codon:yes gene_type:complete